MAGPSGFVEPCIPDQGIKKDLLKCNKKFPVESFKHVLYSTKLGKAWEICQSRQLNENPVDGGKQDRVSGG